MISRAAQMIEKLLGQPPQKQEPPRRRAAPNTTTSMRALTDLGESIAASAGRASSSAVISASIVQISFFMSE